MLLSIPTSALTYDDVRRFLSENHREGVGLDYKENFPKGLEKTICAMANSYGGTIIIGVKDADGYPENGASGLPGDSGYVERVVRISVDNISPAIVPEVAVCKNASQELCFVVVRIPQGQETPYTVRRNHIYIRTGDVNTPDDLATLERIQWLAEGRLRAARLRTGILDAMTCRSKHRGSIQGLEILFGLVSISFGPIYPFEPLFSDKDMLDIGDRIKVAAYGTSLPESVATGRTVQGGMSYFVHRKPTEDYNYLEINKFGYLFYQEDMGERVLHKSPTTGELEVKEQKLESYRIVRAVDLLINAARKMYATTSFRGNLGLTVRGERLYKVPVQRFPGESRWAGERSSVSVDNELVWSQEWAASDLETFEARTGKILDLGKDVTFSFGFPHEESFIRGMLNRHSPRDSG